jgi:hypothetical protein
MNDAADDPEIIRPPRLRLVLRKKRLNHRPLHIAQPKFVRHEPNPNRRFGSDHNAI